MKYGNHGEGNKSPSTYVGDCAKRTAGQAHTMKGSAGGPAIPCPNQQLNAAKMITIEPGSDMGHKRFDKK